MLDSGEGEPPTNNALKKAFHEADTDSSGGIDKTEFIALYAKIKREQAQGATARTKRGFGFGRRSLGEGRGKTVGHV